jgi:hypothetical protein
MWLLVQLLPSSFQRQIVLYILSLVLGAHVVMLLVDALRYKPEGRDFSPG